MRGAPSARGEAGEASHAALRDFPGAKMLQEFLFMRYIARPHMKRLENARGIGRESLQDERAGLVLAVRDQQRGFVG